MASYSATISETSVGIGAPAGAAVMANTIAELARSRGFPVPALSLTISASGHITSTATFNWLASGVVNEKGKATAKAFPALVYGVTVAELAHALNSLNTTISATINEHATVSATISAIAAIIVHERAVAHGVITPLGMFNAQVIETAKSVSLALLSLHGVVNEHSLVTSAFLAQSVASLTIIEHILAQNYTVNNFVIDMMVTENGTLTDQEIIQAIYSNTVKETGFITVAYVAPNGSMVTWVMNTRTNAVTEYVNWQFNSFASIGRKYLGASSTGLYELDGTRDGTQNIVSDMAGGYLQMNGAKFAGLKGVYIGMRGQGDYLLKMVAGDGREYTYQFKTNPNLMTSKIRTGKGLRARYLQWELISTGPDFDLDTIEFIPMVSDRRV